MSTQSILARMREVISISHLLTTVNILFIGLATWLIGNLTAMIIENRVLVVPQKEVRFVPQRTIIEDRQRPFSEFGSIIENNVFNAEIESKDAPQIIDVEETITAGEVLNQIIADLELLGIHYRQGNFPYAIIRSEKKKEEDVFTVRDEVFETGATIKRIYASFNKERVILQLGKEIGVLTYRIEEEEGEKKKPSKNTSITRSKPKIGSKTNTPSDSKYTSDGKNFYISSTEVDSHLNDFGSLLNQARMVPYFKDGKHQGFKVKAIDKGSLYEKLGLKNNDIISAVNGESLADAGGEKLMGLFKLLRNEREFTIEIERQGKPDIFNYYVN